MKWLQVTVTTLLFLILPNFAFAAERPSQFEKPEEVVAWLYRDFGWECYIADYFGKDILVEQPRPILERYFISRLSSQIIQDRAFQRKTKELGHINFVLLFGTQDPDGICNLRITKKEGTNSVTVRYDQNGRRDIMEMQFNTMRTPAGWRISDIHYKSGGSKNASEIEFSLGKLLSQPYD